MLTGLTLAAAVYAFSHAGGAFIQLPTRTATWIELDDAAGTCAPLAQSSQDVNGTWLRGPTGVEYFLSTWGLLYERAGEGPYTVTGEGAWLHDREPHLSWFHYIANDAPARGGNDHSYYWYGESRIFLNDPRFGKEPAVLDARYSRTWLTIDGDNACQVLHEAQRAYGERALQTVTLDGWILQTGKAKSADEAIPGNWLR